MTTAAPGIASPGTPDPPGLPARPRPAAAQRSDRIGRLRMAGPAQDQARPRAALRRDRDPGRVHAACSPTCSAARWPARPSRYLQFILPGTLVMAVLLVSMYAGIGLNTDSSKGLADRFRSLPIWRPAPITGALLGDVARYLLAAGLVAGLGLAIGYRPPGGAPGVLAGTGLLLLFALSLSWAWTTLGLVMRTPQAVMSTGTVVLFPLTLASNVFVRPQTMPGWLQAFVKINPVSHLVDAERGLLAGHPPPGRSPGPARLSGADRGLRARSPPGSTAGTSDRGGHRPGQGQRHGRPRLASRSHQGPASGAPPGHGAYRHIPARHGGQPHRPPVPDQRRCAHRQPLPSLRRNGRHTACAQRPRDTRILALP